MIYPTIYLYCDSKYITKKIIMELTSIVNYVVLCVQDICKHFNILIALNPN